MTRVRVYTYVSSPDEVMAAARADAAVMHKLYGGNRVETGAVGIGPTAQRWLRENGPPVTTGYCDPVVDEVSKEVRVVVLDDVQTRVTRDGSRLLTAPERVNAQAMVDEAVDRVRSNPGGAGGLGRGNSDGVASRP